MILTQKTSYHYPYAERSLSLLGEREERSEKERIGEVIPSDDTIGIVDDCLLFSTC